MNCKGGLQSFAVYFWHSEGWTARNEALLETVILRIRDTQYPWLMACDANMEPNAFVQGRWFDGRTMVIRVAAADVSKWRSRRLEEVDVERRYDYVVACKGLHVKKSKSGRS